MTQRRVQLIGHTTGADFTVDWNGTTVFTGTVEARGTTDEPAVLAEWQCDTAVTGPVPLTISVSQGFSVSQGSLAFVTIMMNHVCPGYVAPLLSDAAQWSRHQPTATELATDLNSMSDGELMEKYAIDRATLKSWLIPQKPIPAEDNLREPFEITEDNDGKLNLAIDGVPHHRHSVHEYWGAWQWGVLAGQTLTCDILIDPNIVQG